MSGTGGSDEDDLRAGEYVLGLLEVDSARVLVEEAEQRPELAAAIERWETRLAPLLAQVPPVDPPAALWTRLEASAFGAPGAVTGRRRGGLWNNLPVWRAAAAGLALAAGVAGIALLRQTPAVPVPVAALLPIGGQEPAIVASTLPDGRLALRPVGTLTVAAGHDLELWSLPAGAAQPVSLGPMRPGGVVLAAGRAPRGAGKLLISLEPPGGSTTGLPTGPVLWAGTVKPQGS
jgi:anti-sigma-K factor RskA